MSRLLEMLVVGAITMVLTAVGVRSLDEVWEAADCARHAAQLRTVAYQHHAAGDPMVVHLPDC